MTIKVKLFFDLVRYLPPGAKNATALISLEDGATLQDLLARLCIPDDCFKSMLVNGINATGETRLVDNDFVVLFPPMAGG